MKKILRAAFILFNLCPFLAFANAGTLIGQLQTNDGKAVHPAEVFVAEIERTFSTDANGQFEISDLVFGEYSLTVFAEGFNSSTLAVHFQTDRQTIQIELEPLSTELQTIEISDQALESGFRHLRGVEGVAIYAAKKSEVIYLDQISANLATNNAREVYRGVAGLNVWENDGAGLQLAIGARGLDPNRTSNFNTRQNGFDISADALGYPESYYTPPAQALQKIEVVRGAASLQYGTQFGGLLNFKLKEGNPDKELEILSEQTAGSFGLFNSFNSLSGTKGNSSYYTFYQYKRGDGWRPNSGFEQHTAYLDFHQQVTDQFRVGIEVTHMNYLAQQAGGLMDFEFRQDARQSKRERNWFKVNWNLAALHLDYEFSERTKLNIRNFLLYAERDALGELGPINRPDPLRERDLIVGGYQNWGSEARLLHQYQLGGQLSSLVVGGRYYQGFTTNQQGDASADNTPDFEFLNPENLEQSSYEFPSRNVALFAENLMHFGERWSVTPGVRIEYIRTSSDGFYKERVFSGGEVIFEQQFEDQRENVRSFPLFGLGVGYRVNPNIEAYGNLSQNYRAINFSDLAVVNPNLIIDSLLQDEEGYNADLGLRGTLLNGLLRFDASAFYLRYNNRIGLTEISVPDPIVIERLTTLRTNIGDARVYGLELYAEADIWKIWKGAEQELSIRPYLNFSLLNGRYLSGGSTFIGKEVELIPPMTIKTGVSASYNGLHANFLYTSVQEHFTDATNAVFVSNATRGLIPTYQVLDASISYEFRSRYRLQVGINNLADARYFTRRATGYPGPGIIPAEARSFYVGVRVRI